MISTENCFTERSSQQYSSFTISESKHPVLEQDTGRLVDIDEVITKDDLSIVKNQQISLTVLLVHFHR